MNNSPYYFNSLDDQTNIESILSRPFEGSGDASLKNSLDLALSLFG